MELHHLARLLDVAPNLVRLAATGRQALLSPDEDARQRAGEQLRETGFFDLVDVAQPGSGSALRTLLQEHLPRTVKAVHQAWHADPAAAAAAGDVVEGEYRGEVYGWERFAKALVAAPSGVYLVIGPPGKGKTTLAEKLAWLWQREHGYPVEGVNLYLEDGDFNAIDDLRPIRFATFAKRMATLSEWLDTQGEPDDEDDEDEMPHDALGRQVERFKRRVVVFEEQSLLMAAGGRNRAQLLLIQAAANCRHLEWPLILIAQTASMLTKELFALAVAFGGIFVMEPSEDGDERHADRDNPLVAALYQEAAVSHREARRHPCRAAHPDRREWTHVRSSLGGGYRGPMPFKPAWASPAPRLALPGGEDADG